MELESAGVAMAHFIMTRAVLAPLWKGAFFDGVRSTIPESRQLREVPNGTWFHDGHDNWAHWCLGRLVTVPANKVPAIYRTWVLILS